MTELTQEYLHSILDYDPDSGAVTWKCSRGGVSPGSIAGSHAKDGYRKIGLDGNTYQLHRLIWFYVYGAWPENQIDHINHVPTDNRLCNLRDVTHVENSKNAKLGKNNTSGFTGVSWCKQTMKWYSQIFVGGSARPLGRFVNKADAVEARVKAEEEYGFHWNHGVE